MISAALLVLMAMSVGSVDLQTEEYRNTFFQNSYNGMLHHNSVVDHPARPSYNQQAAAYYPFTFFSRQSQLIESEPEAESYRQTIEETASPLPILTTESSLNNWYRPSRPIVYQYQSLGQPLYEQTISTDDVIVEDEVLVVDELKPIELESEGSGSSSTEPAIIVEETTEILSSARLQEDESPTPGTESTLIEENEIRIEEASVTSSSVVLESGTESTENETIEPPTSADNDKLEDEDASATPPPTTPANDQEEEKSAQDVTTALDPLTTTTNREIIADEPRTTTAQVEERDATTTRATVDDDANLPLPAYLRPHSLGLQYDPPRYLPTVSPPRSSGYRRQDDRPPTTNGRQPYALYYSSTSFHYY